MMAGDEVSRQRSLLYGGGTGFGAWISSTELEVLLEVVRDGNRDDDDSSMPSGLVLARGRKGGAWEL